MEHELFILNEQVSRNADDEKVEVIDTLSSPQNSFDEAESSIFLQETLSLLTLQQKKVITATVLEGKTEYEAAKRLGMSQPAVHQMKERALNRLRNHLDRTSLPIS